MGDAILQQALQMELKETSRPLLILEAKRERCQRGVDVALKTLKAAETM